MKPWACVCGWWHESAPHVQTDQLGHVLHAPVSESEEVLTTY